MLIFFKLLTKDLDSTYLYRNVPELLHPREPHPRSPEHLNHLHGMAVPLHQVLLHLLDGDSPICLALPFLQLNLHAMQWKQKNTDLVHLLDDVFRCYLDVSIDHPLPLPRYQITTSLRKVVLTRNLASSSTSSSFERGHSILSAIHKI